MSRKMVLLYVGKNQSGVTYPEYTEADIKGFSSASEFVIVAGTYRNYLLTDTTHKAECNDMLIAMATLVTRIRRWTGKHVWVGVPDTPAPTKTLTTTTCATYATRMKECLSDLRSKINSWMGDSSGFDTYVTGVYMAREHILVPGDSPAYGVSISASNPTAHPEVAMMNTVASYVHNTLGKKMLWIPYYGYGSNYNATINSIGYVANKTNIFDYVLLQPHYYFQESADILKNVEAIRESAYLNKVVGRKSSSGTFSVIGGTKTSNTKIGVEMEIDKRHEFADYAARYDVYAKCFSNQAVSGIPVRAGYNKDSIDFAFYCDGPFTGAAFTSMQSKINSFYA